MRAFTSLILLLFTAACMDIESRVVFTGPDRAEVTQRVIIDAETRSMIDENAGDMCEGARQEVLADGSQSCTFSAEFSLDALTAPGDLPEAERELLDSITVERLGEGQVRVSYDLTTFRDATTDKATDETRRIVAMFLGHTFTMEVGGGEIVSANGEIAADGRSAAYVLDFTESFENGAEIPERFEVVLRLP